MSSCGLYFAIFVICESCLGQDILKYSIFEELSLLSIIGNVKEDSSLRATASAEDFLQISFSFLSTGKAYETYFKLDSGNGTLFTVEKIDREAIPDCQFKIACVIFLNVAAISKSSAFFRTLKINIAIVDINDHSPIFPVSVSSIHISELATVGSSLTLPGAVDDDIGNNSLQRYFILGEDRLKLPFAVYSETLVDGTSVVKLEVNGTLDRETKESYILVIVAEDGGNPKCTGTMTVNIIIDDVNDNAPKFTQSLYNVTLNETTNIGDEILKVTATDADTGVNGEVVYKLSKNQIGRIQDLFKMDENTGVLSVKANFTSDGQYGVIVESSDKGIQHLVSQTVVFVNVLRSDNNPPVIKMNLFSEDNVAQISENAEIGTVVAHIMVIDQDTEANGVITCNINSDGNKFGLQNLALNEFKVTVSNGLDRETNDFINVIVNCSDIGLPPKYDSVEFYVQVMDENDNSPSFLSTIYNVNMEENNDINAEVVKVTAVDKDIGKNGEVSYSVFTTDNYHFTVDLLSDVIRTQTIFNRETNSKIILYAYAKDNGIQARTSTATIVINILDQNDNDPKFSASLYEFSVSENLPYGTIVGAINVSDEDTGNNSELTFLIASSLPFHIDNTGIIRTKESLDRELKSTYNYIITVFDHGTPSRSAFTSVIVHINDVNDCTPKFIYPDSDNYTVEIADDAKPHEIVTTIKAYDLDSGQNSLLLFSILNLNDSNLFLIDGQTGIITLSRSVLDTDNEIYNIVLLVNDRGNPVKNATTFLDIFIVKKEVKTSGTVAKKGANILIAIVLGTVTSAFVFTIIVIICVLETKVHNHKLESDSKDQFCEQEKSSNCRQVPFSDLQAETYDSSTADARTMALKSTTTCDSNRRESRESDKMWQTVNMEKQTSDQHTVTKETLNTSLKHGTRDTCDGQNYRQCASMACDHNQLTCKLKSKSPSEVQLATMLLFKPFHPVGKKYIKPANVMATIVHDDNHSQISGETITSDSGRGGSVTDIHSAHVSQLHDSDMMPVDCKHMRHPVNTGMVDSNKAWLNLVDLRNHNFHKPPVPKQVNHDHNHRLKLRTFVQRNSFQNDFNNSHYFQSGYYTQSDINYDRTKIHSRNTDLSLPPPSSGIGHSFMTYDEDDDDISTTTSGSYIIDHEDLSLDFRPTLPSASGLGGCLV